MNIKNANEDAAYGSQHRSLAYNYLSVYAIAFRVFYPSPNWLS